MKYDHLNYDIQNSTIPFFMVPRILVISPNEPKNIKYNCDDNVFVLDTSLNKIFCYI